MIRVRPAIRSPYPPRTRVQTRVTKDDIWRALWPYITTNVVAGFLILVLLLIGALETASLAISTEPDVYGYTSSTGSGFWCGFYIFIAAVLIISINFVCFIRLWSTLAVIATIIAACFCGIIIGLDAKAVQDGRDRFGSLPRKSQVLAAQLAFAIVEMILCIVFIVIYIFVAIVVHYRLRRLHRGLHR